MSRRNFGRMSIMIVGGVSGIGVVWLIVICLVGIAYVFVMVLVVANGSD